MHVDAGWPVVLMQLSGPRRHTEQTCVMKLASAESVARSWLVSPLRVVAILMVGPVQLKGGAPVHRADLEMKLPAAESVPLCWTSPCLYALTDFMAGLVLLTELRLLTEQIGSLGAAIAHRAGLGDEAAGGGGVVPFLSVVADLMVCPGLATLRVDMLLLKPLLHTERVLVVKLQAAEVMTSAGWPRSCSIRRRR